MKRLLEKLNVLNDATRALLLDVGLLVGRLAFGLTMLIAHGNGKLMGFGSIVEKFPDPLGVGQTASLGLAVFAEFFCSILLAVGLFTRIAALNLIVTMAVAGFIIHGSDPFQVKEKALLFLFGYLVLALTGAGRFSLDRKLFGTSPRPH